MQTKLKQVWAKCLEIIHNEINDQSFKTWFEPIVPIKIADNTLTIEVPSQFFYEWLEENYVEVLRKAIDATLGNQGMLEYSILVDKGDKKNPPISYNIPNQKATQNTTSKPKPEADVFKSPFMFKDLDSLELDSYLNTRYTFNNYIEGDC
nr:chromosomal replication initiator protein DnaA [Pseudarcicella sp.]